MITNAKQYKPLDAPQQRDFMVNGEFDSKAFKSQEARVRRVNKIAACRAWLDIVEANPGMPEDMIPSSIYRGINDKDQAKAVLKAFTSANGGRIEKRDGNGSIDLTITLGEFVVQAWIWKSGTCKKIDTGRTEKVPHSVTVDVETEEQRKAFAQAILDGTVKYSVVRIEEKEVPVTEWDCKPILG